MVALCETIRMRPPSIAISGRPVASSHARAVIVVVAEERPAAAYDGWIDDVSFSYAVALRVSRVDCGGVDRRFNLRLLRHRRRRHAAREVGDDGERGGLAAGFLLTND